MPTDSDRRYGTEICVFRHKGSSIRRGDVYSRRTRKSDGNASCVDGGGGYTIVVCDRVWTGYDFESTVVWVLITGG